MITLSESKERLIQVLGRFIQDGDSKLSDRDFVLELFKRYSKYLEEEIIDVNE